MFTQADVDQVIAAVWRRKSLAECQLIVANCGKDIITAGDSAGWTALHWAVCHSWTGILDWFLTQPINCNPLDSLGNTPLILAAGGGYTESAAALDAHGVNRSIRDREGKTALDRAREKGRTAIVALLEAPQVVKANTLAAVVTVMTAATASGIQLLKSIERIFDCLCGFRAFFCLRGFLLCFPS
eukprot:m.496797 g.496797  ORF g.496797 m.496797 type:complete len:185 (+) comp57307_c1_seq8:44-598(+)